MTEQSKIENHSIRAAEMLAQGDAAAARDLVQSALVHQAQDAELLKLLLRICDAMSDAVCAQDTAARLRGVPLDPDTLDTLIGHALSGSDFAEARALIADAEAAPDLPTWATARAKARVAQALGDLPAATAILVEAIEAAPDAAPLRTLLTEVLMAGGSAGHARDVLTRLGLPPNNPEAQPGSTAGARGNG